MKTIQKIKGFFKNIPDRIKAVPKKLAARFAGAKEIITQGNGNVSASMIVMGLGQLMYKQWVKGFMFLFIQIAFIVYFVLTGGNRFVRLFYARHARKQRMVRG